MSYGNAEYTALSSDAWLEWNSRSWNLHPHRVSYATGDGSLLTGVLYTDREGRVRMPRLNPYLPFSFRPSGKPTPERIARQWEGAAALFVEDLLQRKIVGKISLPPTISDARPFQWGGLSVEPRYTFTGALPHDLGGVTSAVRKNFAKAERSGFRFDAGVDPAEVVPCLESTGARQGFDYRVTTPSLRDLVTLIGDVQCRTHVVRDPAGEVVSAGVRLVSVGGAALDWVQGAKADALRHGVVQLMYRDVLADMNAQGATVFDYGGANIKAVAHAKAAWGMGLTQYLTIGQDDARRLYAVARGAIRRMFPHGRG